MGSIREQLRGVPFVIAFLAVGIGFAFAPSITMGTIAGIFFVLALLCMIEDRRLARSGQRTQGWLLITEWRRTVSSLSSSFSITGALPVAKPPKWDEVSGSLQWAVVSLWFMTRPANSDAISISFGDGEALLWHFYFSP